MGPPPSIPGAELSMSSSAKEFAGAAQRLRPSISQVSKTRAKRRESNGVYGPGRLTALLGCKQEFVSRANRRRQSENECTCARGGGVANGGGGGGGGAIFAKGPGAACGAGEGREVPAREGPPPLLPTSYCTLIRALAAGGGGGGRGCPPPPPGGRGAGGGIMRPAAAAGPVRRKASTRSLFIWNGVNNDIACRRELGSVRRSLYTADSASDRHTRQRNEHTTRKTK